LDFDGLFIEEVNEMDPVEAFALFDCNLVRCALGRTVTNLRELLDAVKTAPDAAIEHHMMRCALDDHFELYEFPNDLARWCREALGNAALGEELGLVDPYQHESVASLRAALANTIEERLWGMERVPACPPGLELHLIASSVIAYDTGERFASPASLAASLPSMTRRSLFYHVHEARRRSPERIDDFSLWLEQYGADRPLVAKLRAIDFYFLNLNQLRREIIEAFRQYLPEPEAVMKVPTERRLAGASA
jgi:hypothetical protein